MRNHTAHGNESKYGNDYTPGKRINYTHESSASYNRRVKVNSLIIGVLFLIVICGAMVYMFG